MKQLYQIQIDNELYHHGILGMRWGHRKPKESKSSYKNPYATVSSNIKMANNRFTESGKKTKKINIKDMSNKELQSLIDRKRLENDWYKVNNDKLLKLEKAARFVDSISKITVGAMRTYQTGNKLYKEYQKKSGNKGKKKK